jgi:ligand-binding SRPBCC domain-containing protein
MPRHFVRSVDIQAPIDAVFAWHEQPGALRALTPPKQRLFVLKPLKSLDPGERTVLLAFAGLMPTLWYVEHVAYIPPHAFVDRQLFGPFWRWEHEHRFAALPDGGTRMTDAVTYELPGGKLGDWLGHAFVERQLDAMFAHRHRVTKAAIEPA